MNNIFTIMKKELFRYLSDRRMLLTTILLPGLMIYIVYSIMGQAMSSQFEVKDDYKTSVFMLDTPQSLKPVFDSLNLDYRDADKSMDEMKMQVENQDCDLIVVFPKDFEQAVAAYDSMTAQTPVKVADMSTGMKQKISLVISIVHNPDIIIFDEPTNGLDVITERIVVNFLKELREQGKCIIISSHIFSLIEKICDRVVIIIRGKSVCCDTLENVMAGQPLEDRFFELYENMEGKADE